MVTGMYVYINQLRSHQVTMSRNDTQPVLYEDVCMLGWAVCPGSVSTDKGQGAGNALGFGNKSEALQLRETRL